MTTAIIADDHEIVRRGLRGIIEADGNMRVIAEAADGLAATQLVDKHKPTLLILDLNMPRLHGIDALRAGASAYILKGSESQEISQALKEVLGGRRFLSATLSEWAINALVAKPVDEGDPLQALTPR